MASVRQIIAALLLASLAACGGGGGAETTNPTPTPRSGEIDTSYGTGGFVLMPGSAGIFSDMAVAPDGSVFLTGAAVLKLDAGGAIDSSYGSGGRVVLQGLGVPIVLHASSPVLDEAGVSTFPARSRSTAKAISMSRERLPAPLMPPR